MRFTDPTFWQNFWPDFWSDFAVGVIITAVISWVVSRIIKPDAKVIAAVSHESESTVGIKFGVRNTARVSFGQNEIWWHLFVDRELYVASPSHDGEELATIKESLSPPTRTS